jgi:hypothetical protein
MKDGRVFLLSFCTSAAHPQHTGSSPLQRHQMFRLVETVDHMDTGDVDVVRPIINVPIPAGVTRRTAGTAPLLSQPGRSG